jgi:alkylation response protein AidB-like acyl-CoA dehydrogenase
MELAPSGALEVFEELAAIDSAAAWLVSNVAVITTFFQVFSDDGIGEIFAERATILAGGWFPPGTALRTEGGYQVTGQWAFGTGCRHADWVTGMAVIIGADQQPELHPDGSPRLVLLAVSAKEAEVVEHWDTLGMRGTGSHDVSVADVFVPDRRSFVVGPFSAPGTAFRGPLYRFHMWLGGAAIAAVALGLARAAWDQFHSLAAEKRPSYTDVVLRDRPIVQDHVARAGALIGAGRAYLHDTVDELYARFERGDDVDPVSLAPVQLAACHAVEAARRAVDLLQDVAGTSGIRAESGLERHFRDVHTIAQHALASSARYESVGQMLLGKQSDWLFFYL